MLYMLGLAGLVACNKSEMIGEKEFFMEDENRITVMDRSTPITDFLTLGCNGQRVTYGLEDSSVTAEYDDQARLWKNGDFTSAEQTEFQQAAQFAKQKLGL